MVHSICDSYPKFGTAAPRQTGVITRRKKWGRLTPPSKSRVNPRRHRPFRILPWQRGWLRPLAVSPMIELELRGKNEHVARRETKRLIYKLNTRTGGGAKNAYPSGFSRIAEKRRRAAPPFFQYLLTIEFDTLCKNFIPRSPKVRSPG